MDASLHYITCADPSEPQRPRHLAYYEWGNPANPKVIVCAHGLSRNAHDFDMLAQALAPHYRVLCVDMAGRGKSDWLSNKTDYNYLTYVGDTQALLTQLQLNNVTWIGTSMGGIIGMMLAAQPSSPIRRMVLNDIGAVVSAKGLSRILRYVGSSGIFATEQEALAYLKSVLAPFGITSDAHWQHMLAISFTRLPDGRYALAYDPAISQPFKDSASSKGEITDVDLTALWAAIQCPVLLLRGQLSDILSPETAQTMCASKPSTKLVEFAHVGHAPALLEETQIQTIVDWLDIP